MQSKSAWKPAAIVLAVLLVTVLILVGLVLSDVTQLVSSLL